LALTLTLTWPADVPPWALFERRNARAAVLIWLRRGCPRVEKRPRQRIAGHVSVSVSA
jgi:hypothetical protein